ncbi:hypothetical protein ZWY2020_039870 [Hordeum vulgare]|nr:hypothetical protein ZWY2020_039870 [Hordeum vulgare]
MSFVGNGGGEASERERVPLAVERATLDDIFVWEWSGSAYDEGAEAAEWFSAYFRKPYPLVRFKEGYKLTFEDAFPLLIASQGSLCALNEILKGLVPFNRFRPNNSPTQVIEEVKCVLAFNNLLTVLSKHPQGDRFARGLGPISLAGEQDHDRRASDPKTFYRAYATDVLSHGHVDNEKHSTLDDVFVWEWSGSAYDDGAEAAEWFFAYFGKPCRLVRFKEAPSKASFLQNLCEELQFDPELASKMHEDIYKQKL